MGFGKVISTTPLSEPCSAVLRSWPIATPFRRYWKFLTATFRKKSLFRPNTHSVQSVKKLPGGIIRPTWFQISPIVSLYVENVLLINNKCDADGPHDRKILQPLVRDVLVSNVGWNSDVIVASVHMADRRDGNLGVLSCVTATQQSEAMISIDNSESLGNERSAYSGCLISIRHQQTRGHTRAHCCCMPSSGIISTRDHTLGIHIYRPLLQPRL